MWESYTSSRGSSQSSSGASSSSTASSSNNDQEPPEDGPIGYGAFGVVWSVTDPRDGKRVALKKMPNVFQNLVAARRVYREVQLLNFFKHENVLGLLDMIQPPDFDSFQEIYVLCELMQTDLHKIIQSDQMLSMDHIKLFMYQIVRGLKYIHSAGIIHRDLKPGNLLVNSNCLLKIGDFGLARMEDPMSNAAMTQEVVTQYYRAPEILMGATRYTQTIDIWSVGCIFAELLSRRILFQAESPSQQLELITTLLGTPTEEDMWNVCEDAKRYIRSRPLKIPTLSTMRGDPWTGSREVMDLLMGFLKLNPRGRISASRALAHPYLDEGRMRYHTHLCQCRSRVRNLQSGTGKLGCDLRDPEPVELHTFRDELDGVGVPCDLRFVKRKLYELSVRKCGTEGRPALCINKHSKVYRNFVTSSVAELPDKSHLNAFWAA